jgi:sec-independent protein translocase protein TatA
LIPAIAGPIGVPELVLILLVLLLIFGAARLPEVGKGLGQAIKNFRSSFKDATDDKKDQSLGNSAEEAEK